jgi:hypothetical protein
MTARFPQLPKSRREAAQTKTVDVGDPIEERAQRLMKIFNGAIKYYPMLQDHGNDWTDEECIEFAKELHKEAIRGLTEADELSGFEGWNHGIPYCRNIPTKEMLEEAGYDS